MKTRGIRGAITVKKNASDEMITATIRLLAEMNRSNKIKTDDIAAIIFSATPDLNAEFPARAAREIGLTRIPLFCTVEINVPNSLKKCIRVLMLVNTSLKQDKIKHIYLEEAKVLRQEFSA
ncbi:MAG TPA: chorismate mutase [Candidatus Omnitrophota bacterium]|nr:chorismate mutase [Candidatus Omnitrophota bacterium]